MGINSIVNKNFQIWLRDNTKQKVADKKESYGEMYLNFIKPKKLNNFSTIVMSL